MSRGIDLSAYVEALPRRSPPQSTRERLEETIDTLGGEELLVLQRIAARLLMGQRHYGRLSLLQDERDFRKEAREEFEDALVYLACEYVRRDAAGDLR